MKISKRLMKSVKKFFKVMKKMARDIAFRYGQHSLESFQNIALSGIIDNTEH